MAPTWKVAWPAVPSRTRRPLKVVCEAIRVISAERCCTSASRAARSDELFVPLAASTASWRMRCRLSVKVDSALSAVCDSEIASFALFTAWLRPLICVVKRLLIARPAASSFALLMRRPEDRRCRDVARLLCEDVKLRCAFSEAMLVLIVKDIVDLLKS